MWKWIFVLNEKSQYISTCRKADKCHKHHRLHESNIFKWITSLTSIIHFLCIHDNIVFDYFFPWYFKILISIEQLEKALFFPLHWGTRFVFYYWLLECIKFSISHMCFLVVMLMHIYVWHMQGTPEEEILASGGH